MPVLEHINYIVLRICRWSTYVSEFDYKYMIFLFPFQMLLFVSIEFLKRRLLRCLLAHPMSIANPQVEYHSNTHRDWLPATVITVDGPNPQQHFNSSIIILLLVVVYIYIYIYMYIYIYIHSGVV